MLVIVNKMKHLLDHVVSQISFDKEKLFVYHC